MLDMRCPSRTTLPMTTMVGLLAAKYGKVAYIDRPLLLYRRHEGTVTGLSRAGALTRLNWRLCIAKDLLLYGGRRAHGRN